MREARIILENEKYTFIIKENGTVECLRFGEPWVKFYEGSKALISLIHRAKELEERIELAEATKNDALAYAKMYKANTEELSKLIKPDGQKGGKDD